MSGQEFEDLVAKLFLTMGYNTTITPVSGDQGIDIIAENDRIKIGIQAKRNSTQVSNQAVQEAVAGKVFYNLDRVMVVTNNYYTSSAKELAKANHVQLWDQDEIISRLS